MCGIFGVIDKNTISIKQFVSSLQLMKHRGPDDQGLCLLVNGRYQNYSLQESSEATKAKLPLLNENIRCCDVFGHVRLAIIDLSSGGHQPLVSEDGRYVITYNGEIYNYKELIEKFNLKCKTKSDTEVVLKCFELFKDKCVDYFIGMWAFVVYDRLEKTAFASRDPFGIKPFYYIHNSSHFSYSSEIKSLLSFTEPRPNMGVIYNFVVHGLKNYGTETFFDNIFQLEPGHNLILRNNQINISRYSSITPDKNANPDELYDRFYESLNLHLISDVPVGIALSGGIDSSIIASLLSYKQPELQRLHFSGVCPEPDAGDSSKHIVDESPYINATKNKHGLTVCYSTPTIEYVKDSLEKLIWFGNEPTHIIGLVLNSSVYQTASEEKIKVLLNGQGADEIFAGYGHYIMPYFTELMFKGKIFRLYSEIKAFRDLFHKSIMKICVSVFVNYIIFVLPSFVKKNRIVKKLRAEGFLMESFIEDNYNNDYFLNYRNYNSNLTDALINSFNVPLREYLDIEDKMSMMHSVESRVPFLTLPFVQYGLGIKSHLKITSGIRKNILRNKFKTLLPDEVYSRTDKTGYVSPQGMWMNNINELLEKYLKTNDAFVNSIIKRDFLENLMRENRSQRYTGNKYLRLWRILSVEIWYQMFFKGKHFTAPHYVSKVISFKR